METNIPRAFTGAAGRPDPGRGVFSTMLVRAGVAVDLAAHVQRLERSADELYDQALPDDVGERIAAEAVAHALGRLRVLVAPGPGALAAAEIESTPLDSEPAPQPELLAPVHLPGGLGAHKWRDRRLLDELERRTGATPLIVDLDGHVLEAGAANVCIVEGGTLVTPPLDGRLLPGTVRARVLAVAASAGLERRQEPISLERLAAADEVLLSSAIRGVRPGVLAGVSGVVPPNRAASPAVAVSGESGVIEPKVLTPAVRGRRPFDAAAAAPFEAGARLRRALHEPALVEAR
ncbi:MAG: aminotransferase class IV [Thermoleophilaceae bacterium]|nr:aminotransferase class IV [Thermoleophilaceae bacterium]